MEVVVVPSGGVLVSTVVVHFLTTGCALVLVRRGPNRRLRLLTLSVGLMSLSQTISLLQAAGVWTAGPSATMVSEVVVGALSLLAIHLLAREIYDRNHTDKRLRLIEHETVVSEHGEQSRTAKGKAGGGEGRGTNGLALEAEPSQNDLLRLLAATKAGMGQAGAVRVTADGSAGNSKPN